MNYLSRNWIAAVTAILIGFLLAFGTERLLAWALNQTKLDEFMAMRLTEAIFIPLMATAGLLAGAKRHNAHNVGLVVLLMWVGFCLEYFTFHAVITALDLLMRSGMAAFFFAICGAGLGFLAQKLLPIARNYARQTSTHRHRG